MSKRPRRGERDVQRRCEELRHQLESSTELGGDMGDPEQGLAILVSAETRLASSPARNGLFLYRLVRAFRPHAVVEFGSALGISGIYLASGLVANGQGRLTTVEGVDSRRRIAERTIESAAPGRTRCITARFTDALGELDGADFFFLDGHHDYEPTLAYVSAAVERFRTPALLVLDDVANYTEGMDKAWQELSADDRFSHALLIGRIGLLAMGEPEWPGLRRVPAAS
jgi:predicted O-methyltransferase YrrM